MTNDFKYFAVLAGMRTGSNLLEERLNSLPGIQSYGEAFNPAFVGHANQDALFGMSAADIAANPNRFLNRLIEKTEGLAGFRLFDGHNRQVLDKCLTDPQCAKIVLRRNPVESFVSLKIAQATNQWRMNDAKNAKKARVEFEPGEFSTYLEKTQAHYKYMARQTKAAGQTVFMVDYDDLNNPEVLSGLALFLGVPDADFGRKSKTKKQNPEPLSQKVSNFEEMTEHLSRLDPIGLFNDPSFEPARGPDVKSYVICPPHRLLFAPISGGPNAQVMAWLEALAPADKNQVTSGLSQKEVRTWKRETPGHISFTMLRHPALRAWSAYRTHLIQPGPQLFRSLRQAMIDRYDVVLPEIVPISEQSSDALRSGFLSFLGFLSANLAGQTTIRVDASWATQVAITEAFARFAPVHFLLKEESSQADLEYLSSRLGVPAVAPTKDRGLANEFARVHDAEIEAACRAAYRRDYMAFGFGGWRNLSGA